MKPCEEYWDCTLQAIALINNLGPNLIVDDGGDATLLIKTGYELGKIILINIKNFQKSLLRIEEEIVIEKLLRCVYIKKLNHWHNIVPDIIGKSFRRNNNRCCKIAANG